MAFIGGQNAVTGIGEPDAAVGVDDDVIGGIEGLALPAVRQHRHRAVMFVANHAAGVVLAGKQAALPIKRIAVGVVGGRVEDADVAVLLEPAQVPIVGDIAENQVAPAAVPCGPFGPKQARVQPLDGCALDPVLVEPLVQGDDVRIGIMNGVLAAPVALPGTADAAAAAPAKAVARNDRRSTFVPCLDSFRMFSPPSYVHALPDPLTRPAAADQSAVAVHPLPQGGEG